MNVEIAQRLAELRRARGYSQEELAGELGLSRQAVSKWERAESAPDMGNLIALADLYEVTIDELLRVSDDVADDVRFESQDRNESAETAAAAAAEEADEAARRAADAAAAATAAAASTATAAAATAQAASTATEAAAAAVATPQAQTQSASAHSAQNAVPHAHPVHPGIHGHTVGHQGYMGQGDFAQEHGFSEGQPPAAPSASPYATSGGPMIPAPLPKSPLRSFPYPLLCVVLFFVFGFVFSFWGAWIVFLTIPFWYWAVNTIEQDPNYLAARRQKYFGIPADSTGAASSGTGVPSAVSSGNGIQQAADRAGSSGGAAAAASLAGPAGAISAGIIPADAGISIADAAASPVSPAGAIPIDAGISADVASGDQTDASEEEGR